MEIFTNSPEATQDFGKNFANSLKGGEVIALSGDLGTGKTTFVQGLAEGLKIKERILSPTFILMREYRGDKNLYHIDLYRLENPLNEFSVLGLEEIWGKEQNIIVIEWAEKARQLLPKDTKWIEFFEVGGKRKIKL